MEQEVNLVKWEKLTQEWWDRLGKVYEHLNIIGYQINEQRKKNEPTTKDQMIAQSTAMEEFYLLLIAAGSSLDGPLVQDMI